MLSYCPFELGWLGNILFTSWQLDSLNEKQDGIDIHADFTQLIMSLSVLKHFLSFKQKSFLIQTRIFVFPSSSA